MATPKVYVFCDQNCKYESMTKEQILTAIIQAITEGTVGDVDEGFIQTIKTINGLPLRFFVGDQATYDALTDAQKENLYAIITNDGTHDGFSAAIKELQKNYTELYDGLAKGVFIPKKVENAKNDENGRNIVATYATKAERRVHYKGTDTVIKTGFDNKVFIGYLPSDKTLDSIVGMGLKVAFTNNTTITLGYTAIKSGLAEADNNGDRVVFSFVSPQVPTADGFTHTQIDASLYLEDNSLYLSFKDGAYSYFKFNGAQGVTSQHQNVASGNFTLKSAIWWFA